MLWSFQDSHYYTILSSEKGTYCSFINASYITKYRGTWEMTDPQSETDHLKLAYIDTQIYIYLYVGKISFVHC